MPTSDPYNALLEVEHEVHMRMYSCYKAGDDAGYDEARRQLERLRMLRLDEERALLEPDECPF